MLEFVYSINTQNPIEGLLYVLYQAKSNDPDIVVSPILRHVPYSVNMSVEEIKERILLYAPIDALKKTLEGYPLLEIPDGESDESELESLIPVEEEPEIDPIEKLKADISFIRYVREISGITYNGMTIPTDRNTQQILTAMYIKAVNDPDYTVNFKTDSGFVQLNASMIIAISDMVHDHVQACFDKESELLLRIEQGDEVTVDDFII